jgi:hypothetical protein
VLEGKPDRTVVCYTAEPPLRQDCVEAHEQRERNGEDVGGMDAEREASPADRIE